MAQMCSNDSEFLIASIRGDWKLEETGEASDVDTCYQATLQLGVSLSEKVFWESRKFVKIEFGILTRIGWVPWSHKKYHRFRNLNESNRLEANSRFSVHQITAKYYLLVSYSSLLDADAHVTRVPAGVVFLFLMPAHMSHLQAHPKYLIHTLTVAGHWIVPGVLTFRQGDNYM